MANQLKFFLFNCDNTYNLEVVENFLLDLEEKYGFKFTIDRLTFRLPQLAEVCENTIPKLVMDVAVFVVHADESRLSINEDNADIGYARIYRALLQKTDDNVLIVIGGDSCYKNEDEGARCVISRWAKRKMTLQFGEEYLDGRQSFIFSWNKRHRPIHEEAMRHFLDPEKRGSKFEYIPPKPLLNLIQPVKPWPGSADTDLSRESSLVGSDKAFLIPEDNEEDTGTRRRSFSDRYKTKTGLEEGTYGALRSGATAATYQGDTILLKAKVRYGKISYEDGDVLEGKPGWRPSEKQKSDVMEDLKSDAVCIVTFYQTLDGLVSYSHYKRKPLDRWVFYLYFLIWRCIVSCFEVLFRLFWSVLRQM